MSDETKVSPRDESVLYADKAGEAPSFAWRLTVALRRFASCALVRLHKATPESHHSSLIPHHFHKEVIK